MHRYGVERRLLGGCAGEDGKMTRWGEIKCPRCEELEAQITAMEEGLTAVHMAGYMDGKKAAEAKLAKAVEAMQFWKDAVEPDVDKAIALMDATLAELTGGKDA